MKRRNFIKAIVSTGLAASFAGCVDQPSGTGLRGALHDQDSILAEGGWTSANANIGNTRWNQIGEPRAGLDEPNWSEGLSGANNADGATVYEPVVGERENVFIPGPDAAVRCYDFESGSEKWSVELSAPPAGPVSYDEFDRSFTGGPLLYATSVDGRVTAINPTTGTEAFQTTVGGGFSCGPTAVAGSCYVYTDNPHELVALDRDGNVVWRVGTFPDSPMFAPAIGNNLLYVQTGNGLAGIVPGESNADVGVAWTTATTVRSAPVVRGDTIFFADGQGRLQGIEVDVTLKESDEFSFDLTGEAETIEDVTENRLFITELGDRATGPIAADDQHVYSVLDDGAIEAVSQDDGEYRWRTRPDVDDEFQTLSVSGSLVYATGSNGGLYVLSTINGELLSRYIVDAPFASPVTPVGDSLLASTNGEVKEVTTLAEHDTNEDFENAGGTSADEESEGGVGTDLVSLTTEITAAPLNPRFDQALARAQALDALSAGNEFPDADPLQAEESVKKAIAQFEEGVENEEVAITDADVAIERLKASLAVNGEFLLTFSPEDQWPDANQIDLDIDPAADLPLNTARHEGVGVELARSAIALPFHLILMLANPVGRVVSAGGKYLRSGARSGVRTIDDAVDGRLTNASKTVKNAIEQIIDWIKDRKTIKRVKDIVGGDTAYGGWVFEYLRSAATWVRTLIVQKYKDAIDVFENTTLLRESEKKYIRNNFFGTSPIKGYLTNTGQGLVLDYTGASKLISDLFNAMGELLSQRIQVLIETERIHNHPNVTSQPSGKGISTAGNIADRLGTIPPLVEDEIKDATGDAMYAQAARGTGDTTVMDIRTEVHDAINEYEKLAHNHSDLRATVDDKYYGLPVEVIDVTEAIHGDHNGIRSILSAVGTILGAGWEFLRGYLDIFHEAMKLGFGIAGVLTLHSAHADAAKQLRGV